MVSRSLRRCSRPVASSFQPRIFDASDDRSAAPAWTVIWSASCGMIAHLDQHHTPCPAPHKAPGAVSRDESVCAVMSQERGGPNAIPGSPTADASGHENARAPTEATVSLCPGGTMRNHLTAFCVIATTLVV